MARQKKSFTLRRWMKSIIKWIFFGLLTGVSGGLLGTGFHYALRSVTHLREENNWLIFLLPVGGLLTVALYQVLKLQGNKGTNEIIDATLDGKPVNPLVAVGIFCSTAMTHLFGGSAGREGAALQLGGSTASLLGKLLKLKDTLSMRVMGQDEALELVSDAILRSKTQISDVNRPIGSFLFLGPTGVGKTEVAKALAE